MALSDGSGERCAGNQWGNGMSNYGEIFSRLLRDPSSATADELALLTDEDRATARLRCDVEIDRIDRIRRAAEGKPARGPAHRLPAHRLKALCDLARAGSLRLSEIPLDEFSVLMANPEQRAVLDRAWDEADGA